MKIVNIEWEIDLENGEIYEDVRETLGLPTEIEVPDDIDVEDDDDISDWLSDEFGFCIWRFDIIK